jgi:hypothetical protein
LQRRGTIAGTQERQLDFKRKLYGFGCYHQSTFERSCRTMTRIAWQSLNRVQPMSDFLVESNYVVIELPTSHARQGGIAPTAERLRLCPG